MDAYNQDTLWKSRKGPQEWQGEAPTGEGAS
jgi:hypothetical protein